MSDINPLNQYYMKLYAKLSKELGATSGKKD